MFKKVVLCLAIVGASGCDLNLSNLRPVKWATVSISEVREAVKNKVIAENPPPKDLEDLKIISKNMRLVEDQISTLRNNALNDCRNKHLSSLQEPKKPNVRNDFMRPQGLYVEQIMPVDVVSMEYQKCVGAIERDQLISDLSAKYMSYQDMHASVGEYELENNRRAEQRSIDVVAEYGKLNGFDLIIEKVGDSVIYNSSNMSVDITAGVIAYAAQ